MDTKWTIQKDFPTNNWSLYRDGKREFTFPRGNGSKQSGKLRCLRQLAEELQSQMFEDCPEVAYETAQAVIQLAESSGLAVSVERQKENKDVAVFT